MTRKVLGRGLDAILPSVTPQPQERIFAFGDMIPISLIDPNPDQPRHSMDSQSLKELAQSIKEKGVIQPIIVKKAGVRYQVIAGERRLRASEIAGLSAVPVVIKDIADDDMLLLALIENIQREDLNPVEEARAYESLLKQQGITQEALAEKLGKDRTTITNSLRLLKLPDYILSALIEDKLSGGHARAILTLEDKPQLMRGLFQQIIDKGISVRETEALAKKLKEDDGSSKPKAQAVEIEKDPFVKDAERRLCNRLSAKVEIIKSKSGSGKIAINFSSDDELERLFDMLLNVREK